MYFRNSTILIVLAVAISSCTPSSAQTVSFPTYDPFLPIAENTQTLLPGAATATLTNTPLPPTNTREPTPTRVPVTISPVFTPINLQTAMTPTPDELRILPTPRQESTQYTVQSGDTLGDIAMNYDISLETLMSANSITNPDQLEVGQVLNVPAPNPIGQAPAFKVIPDSELVYGPASIYFDIDGFIQSQNGYLADYEQDVNGVNLSGSEIVLIVAQNYSINPRLLLALLEYQSGWVTNAEPFNISYPIGLLDEGHYGLYRQLTWAANSLNRGYYLWRANAISTVVLNDGTIAPLDPSINAGTAALQYFFSDLDDRATWEVDSGPTGLLLTYYVFFGNPFDYAIEPLVPVTLQQPEMTFPFKKGQTWYFTGGPHGGWDTGSAWAALDFAPPGDNGGCLASPFMASAMADGPVVRASNGALIQDLDNDGYEQTGWVIFYMHIAEDGRAQAGDYLFTGENVGHPSCEGGVSNATHVHIARKYNGEWIAADGVIPFNLDGWVSSGDGYEYDGFLNRGIQTIEARDSASDLNQITH
ncbi:MAG TPA: LysM peptidoglycan-binding domain-containing protein [Anaerolineales bacterium]|nr:LysM peptidoglycan-binding domain-containing protein [Anaerolineales bacterium]